MKLTQKKVKVSINWQLKDIPKSINKPRYEIMKSIILNSNSIV